jgi:hypothetical protein
MIKLFCQTDDERKELERFIEELTISRKIHDVYQVPDGYVAMIGKEKICFSIYPYK